MVTVEGSTPVGGRTEQRSRRRRGPSRTTPAGHRSGRARAGAYQRLLEGISRAFASASDHQEAEAATARWVREAVGPDARVEIAVLDERGELRSVFSDRAATLGAVLGSAGSDEVLRSKGPVIEQGEGFDLATATVPMISRGELVGILQIVAGGDALSEAMPSVEVVASQAAIVFRNLRRRSELDREIAMRRSALGLARELITARSPRTATEAVVRFCWEHGNGASAGWVCEKDSMLMRLVAIEGLDDDRVRWLMRRLGSIPRWDLLSAEEQERIIGQFRVIGDVSECVPINAGDVLALTGANLSTLVSVVEELLRDALGQVTTVAWADRRNKQLDVALAWTAHEFRGPLAGVKALLERELEFEELDARETLERTHAEVVQLLDIVDPVLDSAVGSAQLHRQPTNLLQMVNESIRSLDQEDRDRVAVSGSRRATASVDRTLFRVAVTNLIRNAVSHSPPKSEVTVLIAADRKGAEVSVANRGPAIPVAEREIIFDPFIRGRAARGRRGGRGLGLFIARRIVEAHSGRIRVDSSNEGTTFTIRIPMEDVEVISLL
jgi:signal transduction histidine kinase